MSTKIKSMPKMSGAGIDAAATGATMFYAVACYERFNALTYEQCKEAADAAGNASLGYPLYSRDKNGKFPEFDIPHFGKKSSVFCAALMSAFLVWTQRVMQNNPLPGSTLLQAASDGLGLFDRKQLSEYWKGKGAK